LSKASVARIHITDDSYPTGIEKRRVAMNKPIRFWTGQTQRWIALVWLLAAVSRGAQPAVFSLPVPSQRSSAADAVFTNLTVFKLQIEISPAGMKQLRRSGGGFGGWGQRPTVQATVREGQTVYTNVAIHLKGAAGSFRPIDDDPGLTLNFDKFAPGQSFHGLQKLSLNNSVQDPSFLTERICRELFEAAGIPVPRAAHATVELNGRNLGLRVLVEGYNKQFLKRWFKNPKGNLYDSGFVKEITDGLALNSGDNPRDQTPLLRVAQACNDPNPVSRMARLDKVLDLDRFITMTALEVMQCHWDGYALNHNNYRVYHDPDSNKIVFMPHGLDQMFGVERSSASDRIFPHMQGLVAQAVISTPEGHRRYVERMSQLLTNVFQAPAIIARVEELAAVIRPAFDANQTRWHDQQVNWLKARIRQRANSLQQQLSIPRTPVRFDANGLAQLGDWKTKTDSGNPQLDRVNTKGGRPLLHIAAANGPSAGSWRARVPLTSGHYRFEGNIRVQGVQIDPGDSRGGVCLRVSRGALPRKLNGNTEWLHAVYDFDVQEPFAEIELVCELRASSGEAWFDLQSLSLRRL
jgi:hypothetical protein